MKGGKKTFRENCNKKHAGVAILVPDKIDFKIKAMTRDKERPSNSTSGYLSEETQNTDLKECKHPCVHCSITYNCQDMEAT